MQLFSFEHVDIPAGYIHDKQELNRTVTIPAVYDRFTETGRIAAFNFDWKEGQPNKPDIFWDSDVAKWMEGAAYVLKKTRNAELESKVESLIDRIEKFQLKDGYFNIYFSMFEPENRFTMRDCHELYCAGHLFEAAVAYAEATGKERFLNCMKKYADYIYKVFVEEKSTKFRTPGHEEIELALFRMYRYTKEEKYFRLAQFFLEERGKNEPEPFLTRQYCQSHLPIREQKEAVGHAVRAVYLYSGMADLAAETGDEALKNTCIALYENIVNKKMYITGGIGSTYIGEAFSNPYHLPNEQAYAETCAAIGLIFFCSRMLKLDERSTYADTIERAFYNGVLSGISLDGNRFFYENPLEIIHLNHTTNRFGSLRSPITQRVECFTCSCCPPNLNRLFPALGNYIFAENGNTLFINQFTECVLHAPHTTCSVHTAYPNDGKIIIDDCNAEKIAVRIPGWCAAFTANKPYSMHNGYAVFENDKKATEITFDMTPFTIRANPEVQEDAYKLCVQAGPIVYCAESVDNGENLKAISLPVKIKANATYDPSIGLNCLDIEAYRRTDNSDSLYQRAESAAGMKKISLHMIPYSAFANRKESDMLVWFNEMMK